MKQSAKIEESSLDRHAVEFMSQKYFGGLWLFPLGMLVYRLGFAPSVGRPPVLSHL
jgi:hypothetical protein